MVAVTTAILLALASSVAAVPEIAFPINSQVPPVARALKPFSFTFSSTTFITSSPPLVYSLVEAPAWLQLDSGSRTFSGTPGTGDVGAKNFKLVAGDDSGSSTMQVTFIISADSGPGLGVPLAQQLSAFGTLSASQSLVLYPSKPFSISFGPDTFTSTNDQTSYYAACANNTPLPSWINFNVQGLSFTGTTPTFTSPSELPQDFGIELTASNVAGFSGAVATFHIIISNHILAFDSETISIEFTPGQPLSSNDLQKRLTSDGQPIQSSDLKAIHADTPDWLTVDSKSLYITGTPPASTTPFQFTLSATDIYEDTASTIIIISANSSTNLILGKIGAANATVGTTFSYTFDQSLFPVAGTEVTLELGSAASWLAFDASSLTLHGNIPIDLNPQQISLNLTASHVSESQTQSFVLAILEKPVYSTSTSILHTADSTVAPSSSLVPLLPTTQSNAPDDAEAGAQGKDIAAAVVLPLVALLGVGLLAYWCYRKKTQARRRMRQRTSSQSSVAAWKKIISRPFLIEEPSHEAIMEKPSVHHKRVPSLPPTLPEIPGMRGILRNSTQPSAGEPHQNAKRVSKRESRLNITHGRSLLQTMASFAKGGRHEEPTNFALIGEEIGLPRDINSSRDGSVSKNVNRPPNGVGHGKAPSSFLPNFDFNNRPSRLSRNGTHPFNGLGHGKSIPTPPGGPFGHGRAERSLQTGSSDGWHTTDGSSNSSAGPALKDFPKPPSSSIRVVPSSPTYSRSSRAYPRTLYPSGPSIGGKSGRGSRLPSNHQATGDSSASQGESSQSSEQGPSTGELPNCSYRASSWYSQTSTDCPLHGSQMPPLPPIPNPKLNSSSSTAFLRKYLPRALNPKASTLTMGSEGNFANPVESEDENGGEHGSNPSNALDVPVHTIFQGGSVDRLSHPGPLTANGISVQTWRGSREIHQTLGGAHSASGSSGGSSSTSSTGSEGQNEAHRVGVGEVGRKVSVESSIRRNRPVSRSMRAETEGAFL